MADTEEIQEAVAEVVEPKPEPPKPKRVSRLPKKETPPPEPVPEESEEETPPTLVIHKKHKKAKPRKIIVITADESDVNTDDEEMPQRPRPQVVVKSAPKVTKPVKMMPPMKSAKIIPPPIEEPEEEPQEESNVKIKPKAAPKPAARPPPPAKTDEGKIVGEKPNGRLQQAQHQSVMAQKSEAQKKSLTGDPWLDSLFQL